MKLSAPGGGAVFIGPHLLLPADKARHVGEAVAMVVAETKAQAMDAAEAVDGRLRRTALRAAFRRRDAARRADRCGTKCPDNVLVDTLFGDAEATDRRICRRRACRRDGISHRPRHRRADGAARGARPITMPRPAATRSMPAPAARCGRRASSPRCSAFHPTGCAWCRLDVGGNFGTRNRVFVEFGLALWASQKLGRPVKFSRRARNASSPIIRAAISSPRSSSRSTPRHASSPCARPISAMSARAACRCRR